MTALPLPAELTELVLDNLREIPDFPEPGVLFRDITPLLTNGKAFATLIDGLAGHYRGRIDAVAGLESRGFILVMRKTMLTMRIMILNNPIFVNNTIFIIEYHQYTKKIEQYSQILDPTEENIALAAKTIKNG